MRSSLLAQSAMAVLAASSLLAAAMPSRLAAQEQDDQRGMPVEPSDAAEIRTEMTTAESLLGKTLDRGAVLYFLAVSRARLREILPALEQLQQCVALKEGFDPSGDHAFAVLRSSSDFRRLVDQVHKDFPAVNDSHIAFTTTDKDVFPEGLEYDPANDSFYLSSIYRPKILKISHEGKNDEFVPASRDRLLPILGIRMDPADGTIWADSANEDAGKSELLHFDRTGALIGRYRNAESGKHVFNDLVVLREGTIFLTDSLAGEVYRFDREDHSFTPLHVSRPLLFPNGIATTDDESALYVADQLGVLRMDLKTDGTTEIDPGPRSTLAGIDGLYWHKGSLVGVQNGIGTPRVAAFRLSADGLHVVKTTVLVNSLATPTTGAIRGDDFYFIVNSQGDNLNGAHILDLTKLQPVRIAVVHLP